MSPTRNLQMKSGVILASPKIDIKCCESVPSKGIVKKIKMSQSKKGFQHIGKIGLRYECFKQVTDLPLPSSLPFVFSK